LVSFYQHILAWNKSVLPDKKIVVFLKSPFFKSKYFSKVSTLKENKETGAYYYIDLSFHI